MEVTEKICYILLQAENLPQQLCLILRPKPNLGRFFFYPVQKCHFSCLQSEGEEISRPGFNLGRQKIYSKPALLSKGKVEGLPPQDEKEQV